jgi:hypothetical protein
LISDSTSIVALSYEILQGSQRQFILHAIQIDAELPATYSQVAFCEFVADIPAQGSEFTALLHESVEKAETKEQSLEGGGMQTGLEELFSRYWVRQEGNHQIVLESFCGLIGHFEGTLQDRLREDVAGIGSEPQPERGVQSCLPPVHFFHDLL